ncbi:hypothetical protein DDW09_00905 [Sulfolobus sp. SCGC AB-777_L09]|jgi:hypothetical protein|nr:hypothetical protein DDW09_00905 [Sulfolobus sp. SCGC AB-777_L09]
MTSLEEYLTADELEFVKELGVSKIRVIQKGIVTDYVRFLKLIIPKEVRKLVIIGDKFTIDNISEDLKNINFNNFVIYYFIRDSLNDKIFVLF